MKNFIAILSLFFMACGAGSSDPNDRNTASDSQIETTPSSQKNFSKAQIKITKNGETIADFEAPGASALLDEGHLSIEFNSPDRRHSLMVEIENAQTGSFPITNMTQNNKAVLNFMSDDLPSMLSPNSGNLKISEMTETRCSGTFLGNLERDGNRFTVEGSFENISVRAL